MRRGSPRFIAALAASAALVVLPSLPAAAVDAPGLWYVDAFHLPAAWDAGYTGEGVTVALIDTQIHPDIPTLDDADITVHEPSYCADDDGAAYPATTDALTAKHGTNTASYVVGNGAAGDGVAGVFGAAPGAKLLYYTGAINPPTAAGVQFTARCSAVEGGSLITTIDAVNAAIDDGADIISISLALGGDQDWTPTLVRAAQAGVVILVGLPDVPGQPDGLARSNSVVAVQAIGADGAALATDGVPNSFEKVTVSNAGVAMLVQGSSDSTAAADKNWTDQSISSGTSIATPLTAGFLAVVKQKYPKATGNQLIQTLIHNTGAGNPELTHDNTYGYGIASLTTMLTVDPTTYPDVNPLITDDPGVTPAAAEFAAASSSAPSDEVSASPSTAPVVADDAGPNLLVVAGIAVLGALVLAGLIVLIVMIARRPPSTSSPSDGQTQTGA